MSYYTIEGHSEVHIRTLRYAKRWVLSQPYEVKIALDGKHILRYSDEDELETRTEIRVRKNGYPTFSRPDSHGE